MEDVCFGACGPARRPPRSARPASACARLPAHAAYLGGVGSSPVAVGHRVAPAAAAGRKGKTRRDDRCRGEGLCVLLPTLRVKITAAAMQHSTARSVHDACPVVPWQGSKESTPTKPKQHLSSDSEPNRNAAHVQQNPRERRQPPKRTGSRQRHKSIKRPHMHAHPTPRRKRRGLRACLIA